METLQRAITSQNWITLLLVGCLILLATAKFFYTQQFIDVIKLNGADRFLSSRTKGNYFLQPIPLVLLIIQLLAGSLLLYLIYCFWNDIDVGDRFYVFFYILIGYSLFETLKTSLEIIAGYLLGVYKNMRPYFYRKASIKNWIGLFILFGCFIGVYTPNISYYTLYVIIGLAVLIYAIYSIWLLSSYSEIILRFPFYFILYFCALEIAPYFILYKYVIVL